MTRRPAGGETAVAKEIAPEVYYLGPMGRVQNAVYFVRSGGSWVAIDAGSALRLARIWDCKVYMHPDELPIASGDFAAMQACAGPLDHFVVLPLMRMMGTRRREAVLARSSLSEVARAFEPGAGVPGLPDWECVPTPGHTPGHVSYFRTRDRVLISGDALMTLKVNSWSGLLLQRPGLSGPPWYTTWNRHAAKESVEVLAREVVEVFPRREPHHSRSGGIAGPRAPEWRRRGP